MPGLDPGIHGLSLRWSGSQTVEAEGKGKGKMTGRKRSALALALLACLVLVAGPAAAQSFPAKPVKIVVPQAPGGATDVLARAIGQKRAERWGHPVVVENR